MLANSRGTYSRVLTPLHRDSCKANLLHALFSSAGQSQSTSRSHVLCEVSLTLKDHACAIAGRHQTGVGHKVLGHETRHFPELILEIQRHIHTSMERQCVVSWQGSHRLWSQGFWSFLPQRRLSFTQASTSKRPTFKTKMRFCRKQPSQDLTYTGLLQGLQPLRQFSFLLACLLAGGVEPRSSPGRRPTPPQFASGFSSLSVSLHACHP